MRTTSTMSATARRRAARPDTEELFAHRPDPALERRLQENLARLALAILFGDDAPSGTGPAAAGAR